MTAIVKADNKSRVLIRGAESGRQYIVTSQNGGWWVAPAPDIRPPKKRRQWAGSKVSLSGHLRALAKNGLRIEQSANAKEPVGPCPF